MMAEHWTLVVRDRCGLVVIANRWCGRIGTQFTTEASASVRLRTRRQPQQKRMRRRARGAARIFLTRWRRKALWQTKQCLRGTDRKCCQPCALPADYQQPLRSLRRLRPSLVLRRAWARTDADPHLDFRKAFVPSTRHKPFATREETVRRKSSRACRCPPDAQQALA